MTDSLDKISENTFSKKDRIIVYCLLTFQVIAWGFDYVVAKHALELLEPLTLLFLKYLIGLIPILLIKMKMDRQNWARKKDIPLFILCSIFGEILYFACEYNAMDYLPISLISIILAFVPVVSIIIEKILYKRVVNKKMFIGVAICIFGVALIIGVDFEMILQGRWFGYILAFGAVFFWNAYNFLTASLGEKYSSITLTCTQLICTSCLLLPYALHNMPPLNEFTPAVTGGLVYLGIVNVAAGFLIMVRGLQVVGPTVSGLFSNFLPITSAFFGWVLLGEALTGLQMLGGVIVVASACVVIREKGKVDITSK